MIDWKPIAIKRIEETIKDYKTYQLFSRKHKIPFSDCAVCQYMKKFGYKTHTVDSGCKNTEKESCPAIESCIKYIRIKTIKGYGLIKIFKLWRLKQKLIREQSLNLGIALD